MVKKLILVLIVISLLLLSIPAMAFAHVKCPQRPGWGYGDKNHCHTGPPGQGFPFPWEIVKFP
ncbi:MAG TPA: hypothetical protein VE439_04445 [Anaerolineae bacterium]|nr:hypothetical protein [Anaerolineae bacterium]